MGKLSGLKKRTLNEPLRCLFYSDEGIGKTTLAADSEAPIILDIEGGSGRVDAVRYPFRPEDETRGHVPLSYAEVTDALDDLATEDHEFKTIIIDTIDALEPLLWAHVCKTQSGAKSNLNPQGDTLTSIESLPYGKGFVLALDEWRSLAMQFDRLRSKGIAVIMLGHAQTKVYKNPLGEDYDRIQLRIHAKAAGFLKGYCDVIGYLALEQGVAKLADTDRKKKGISTGRRLIHLQRTASYDAKTRIPLPAQIELTIGSPWATFAKAIDSGRHATAPDISASIAAELDRIGDDDLRASVGAAMTKAADDTATLSRYLNDLKTRASQETTS